MLDVFFMVFDLVASFVGLVFRCVFGKNARGTPAPDRPSNHEEILKRSLFLVLVISFAGGFFALLASESFQVAGIVFAMVAVVGVWGAFIAAS